MPLANRGRKRVPRRGGDLPPMVGCHIGMRAPAYMKEALERYTAEFNRQNTGAKMSVSSLCVALIGKFLRENGAIEDP